ncbi:hypothetical protein OH77DRAFT_857820 [Trametes cingulata]|nr:hypothetical protein OH77DRAFT_857820 [Trametes cingulata]
MLRNQLLQLAVPLVKTYGFSREALARSVLALPTPHEQPLSDAAVSSLFGPGDEARRTLIDGWLDHAREQMRASVATPASVRDVLAARLRANEPVLQHLPEHVAKIADDACYITGDTSVGPAWFRRRATIAAAYGAAELHQLNSPSTAYQFLDQVLNMTQKVDASVSEVGLFGQYVWRSWASIVKSSGVLP